MARGVRPLLRLKSRLGQLYADVTAEGNVQDRSIRTTALARCASTPVLRGTLAARRARRGSLQQARAAMRGGRRDRQDRGAAARRALPAAPAPGPDDGRPVGEP